MRRHDPCRSRWRTNRFADCEALIREEKEQIEFQEFRRDPYVGGSEFPATDAYRPANLAHVTDTENRERLLVFVEWHPPRVGRLQAADALFRPARQVSTNNSDDSSSSRCNCHKPYETFHFRQSIESVVRSRHGSLAICAASSRAPIELRNRQAVCKCL